MSDATPSHQWPRGVGTLPPARAAAEIAKHPPITDLDSLVIEDLTDDEYHALFEALEL